MTAIFDTHAHYDDDAFNDDREQLLAALPGQGIARVVDVGASLASCQKVLELMEQYDYIYGAIGVHPNETAELTEESYSWLKEQCQKEKCLAVGEIGGVLTFKNAKKLKEAVEYIPMDRIVLETDCPYLAPEPNRGKRNSSLNIPYVIAAMAQIKRITEEEVRKAAWDNSLRLYHIEK